MARAVTLVRVRRWAAVGLLALAAVLLVRPMLAERADPGWPVPDEYQAQLDGWARVLAPVGTLVPAGETLAYTCPADEQGVPLRELDRWFDFIQAVLAPRRIGRRVDARYVLAHFPTGAGLEAPSFGQARVLAELARGLVLVELPLP